MESVFRSEIHKESRSGLGKPERLVFGRDDIRIHRGLYPSLKRRLESQFLFSSTENIEYIFFIVDDPESVRRTSGVQHSMAGLDAGPNGERTFENRLRGFVFPVPRLELIAEEEFNTLDVHLPGRVQPGVVDVRQTTDGRGEMAGEPDGAIEHELVSFRKPVRGGCAFYLERTQPQGEGSNSNHLP